MAENIKKHLDLTVLFGVGLVLFLVCVMSLLGLRVVPNDSLAVTGTVEVTATVAEWMTFSVNPTSTDLGSLVDGAGGIHVGSSSPITLTAGTNSSDGYNIDVKDLNNGLKLGATLLQLATATGTIYAGTSSYGIQATSAVMTVDPKYKWSTSTDICGQITVANSDLAQQAAQGSGFISYVTIKAAATTTSPNGAYTDIITFTALPQIP